jgi:uncharacterized protein (TIGR01777 family)
MTIVIAGGSGFLGRALSERLRRAGHEIIVLTRRAAGMPAIEGVRYGEWDPDGSIGEWARLLDGVGAIVNLSGASIGDRRWSDERKEALRLSRTLSTRSLATAVRIANVKPTVFVQASGVGFYGADLSSREVDESFPPGSDFLGELAVAWEAEAHPVASLGTRLAIVRSGIVLARHGGALPQMAQPFRWFVGGPLGSGTQYISWIHLDDWTRLVAWVIDTPTVSGVINASSPAPATNAEFSRAIGNALGRPSWFPVPGFVLRLIVGEFAEAGLLKGQRAIPRRTQELGFHFEHPALGEAVVSAFGLDTPA